MMTPLRGSVHHVSKSSREMPLCSMPGLAIMTQGPMSSKCSRDLRLTMCLNLNGLWTGNCRRMRAFIMLMYVWYTPMHLLASADA